MTGARKIQSEVWAMLSLTSGAWLSLLYNAGTKPKLFFLSNNALPLEMELMGYLDMYGRQNSLARKAKGGCKSNEISCSFFFLTFCLFFQLKSLCNTFFLLSSFLFYLPSLIVFVVVVVDAVFHVVLLRLLILA